MLKNLQTENINLIILVEGITEEILLPEFSKAAGLDFEENLIKLISSGGKNRLLNLYKKLSTEVNTPIIMIFDSDAAGLMEKNIEFLRETDDAYVIPKGEFEDILPEYLIYRAINDYYRLTGRIELHEIEGKPHKAQVLSDLYRLKGFGEFKKAEFASILADYIKDENDLSEDLKDLFSILCAKIHSQQAHRLYEQ